AQLYLAGRRAAWLPDIRDATDVDFDLAARVLRLRAECRELCGTLDDRARHIGAPLGAAHDDVTACVAGGVQPQVARGGGAEGQLVVLAGAAAYQDLETFDLDPVRRFACHARSRSSRQPASLTTRLSFLPLRSTRTSPSIASSMRT